MMDVKPGSGPAHYISSQDQDIQTSTGGGGFLFPF